MIVLKLRNVLLMGLMLAGVFLPQLSEAKEKKAAAPASTIVDEVSDDERILGALKRHPEVIRDILQQHSSWIADDYDLGVVQRDMERQAAAARYLAEHQVEIFNDPSDAVAGNPHGKHEFVVFFDVQCPWCGKLQQDILQLLKDDPEARIVYKDFPALSRGNRGHGSFIGARAEIAAIEQGKYVELHDALLRDATPENEHKLTEAKIMEKAKAVGIDVDKLRKRMGTADVENKLQANLALASKLNITATPGIVLHSQVIPGYIPRPALEGMLASGSAPAAAAPAAGR